MPLLPAPADANEHLDSREAAELPQPGEVVLAGDGRDGFVFHVSCMFDTVFNQWLGVDYNRHIFEKKQLMRIVFDIIPSILVFKNHLSYFKDQILI